ncbi:type IV secretory system conjugative DNA transfer family protein [Thalassobaculum salexigens]|uniref:type IV secretory system conjugative DNA transfer family protein n=1 Tax=Thalassobaculum salexigens TaxID=455360 RepID=UPI00048F049C|nr:type IV secretion system DNA-binding domain-containing protein [Thalassobaculum salexigens]
MDLAARFHALLNSIGKPGEAEQVRRLREVVARRLATLDTSAEAVASVIAADVTAPPVSVYLAELLARLLAAEGYFALPREDPGATTAELWDLREMLKVQERILGDLDHSMELVAVLAERLAAPVSATEAPSLFRVPLFAQIAGFPEYLDAVVAFPFVEEVEKAELFRDLCRRLERNLEAVDAKTLRLPTRHTSSDPQTLIDAYLAGTPFPAFLGRTVSLPVPQEAFFSHMHVIGGSGAGKTQFLQNLVLHHLDQEDPPALVVVDSQGDFIPKLARLDRFAPGGDLADRLVLISPRDIEHPPAINVFDVHNERLERYDAATREQVVAGVIQTFDYLFTGLLGADLTAKQSVFFRFVARLLIALPETLGRNATILDMIALMDDPGPYLPAIASLPPIQRRFFERDFQSKTFAQTREQIRYRLNAILENPTLERLFTAPETRLDLLRELQRGAVILVDTDKSFLKGASGTFGRIFISLVLEAVLERAAVPERERTPAFLIVDEAAEYFDGNIDDLLTEARKYRLGCVLAHQYLDQCGHSLRASLSANTSIKLAAGVSTGDARTLAPDLRTTAEFILGQQKGHFATYIRNVTGQAVSVPVEFGALEARPRMTEAVFREVVERNRERVSAGWMGGTERNGGTPNEQVTGSDEDLGPDDSPPSPGGGADPDNPDTDAGERL